MRRIQIGVSQVQIVLPETRVGVRPSIKGVRPLCFHLGPENGLADGLLDASLIPSSTAEQSTRPIFDPPTVVHVVRGAGRR